VSARNRKLIKGILLLALLGVGALGGYFGFLFIAQISTTLAISLVAAGIVQMFAMAIDMVIRL
jgi:hypothetical protein